MDPATTQSFVLLESPKNDLAEIQLSGAELLALIRDAVSTVPKLTASAGNSRIDGKSCPPKSMLALLVFCYVQGIYGSRQIEQQIRTDESLRLTLGGSQPDHQLLVEFRRKHRENIQRCLKWVYWFIWVKYGVQRKEFLLAIGNAQGRRVRVSPRFAATVEAEADENVSRAIEIDETEANREQPPEPRPDVPEESKAEAEKPRTMVWRMIGCSAGLIALAGVILAETIGQHGLFQQNRMFIGLALVLAALALWIKGNKHDRQRAKDVAERKVSGETEKPSRFLPFLFSPRYWGAMVAIFAVMIIIANPHYLLALSFLKITDDNHAPKEPVAVAKKPVDKVPEKIPEKPHEKIPEQIPAPTLVEFPEMKLQGLALRENRPSAIINHRTYFVGDQIGEAAITAIDRHGVTLVLGTRTKILKLH